MKVKTSYETRVIVNGEIWEATLEYSNRKRRISKNYTSKSKVVERRIYPVKVIHENGKAIYAVDLTDDRRRGIVQFKESTYRISKSKMNFFLHEIDDWVHHVLGKDIEIVWV